MRAQVLVSLTSVQHAAFALNIPTVVSTASQSGHSKG